MKESVHGADKREAGAAVYLHTCSGGPGEPCWAAWLMQTGPRGQQVTRQVTWSWAALSATSVLSSKTRAPLPWTVRTPRGRGRCGPSQHTVCFPLTSSLILGTKEPPANPAGDTPDKPTGHFCLHNYNQTLQGSFWGQRDLKKHIRSRDHNGLRTLTWYAFGWDKEEKKRAPRLALGRKH